MIKNDLKLKLKIKHTSNPGTPLTSNQNGFFNLNSCPIQNNKFNFNYLFLKDNSQNKLPFQFNSNLPMNEKYNDNSKNNNNNNIQKNLNTEFIKSHMPVVNNDNTNKENNQKTEVKPRKIKPIFQNILAADKINRAFPKIKKNLNSNASPNKEENNQQFNSKSNDLLPLVKKGHKKINNKSKPKNLFHNKSGTNIKINIDCSKKNKNDEKKNIISKNINNIVNKKINPDNIHNNNNNQNYINEKNNYSENSLIKITNIPILKNKKLIDYFYKEEQNLYYKKTMEDFILIKKEFLIKQSHNLSLFAIFDGHGGGHVAEYLKNNFSDVLNKVITENQDLDYTELLKTAIKTIDKDLEKLDNVKECGSTGTIILIDNDTVYCANVGDSKCYYINDKEAIQMTEDHNCKNKDEVEAIKKKGVKVFNGRVFGCLSLTRTFGDTDFKEFEINCEPYITKKSINKDNIKYIIIASDGIWDIVDSNQLFKMQNELKNGSSEELCNNLVEYSLKGGSSDNISCIVLKFGE